MTRIDYEGRTYQDKDSLNNAYGILARFLQTQPDSTATVGQCFLALQRAADSGEWMSARIGAVPTQYFFMVIHEFCREKRVDVHYFAHSDTMYLIWRDK